MLDEVFLPVYFCISASVNFFKSTANGHCNTCGGQDGAMCDGLVGSTVVSSTIHGGGDVASSASTLISWSALPTDAVVVDVLVSQPNFLCLIAIILSSAVAAGSSDVK